MGWVDPWVGLDRVTQNGPMDNPGPKCFDIFITRVDSKVTYGAQNKHPAMTVKDTITRLRPTYI